MFVCAVVTLSRLRLFQLGEIEEAEEELNRIMKGGHSDNIDTVFERIPVENVADIYDTPTGNSIVILKDGTFQSFCTSGFGSSFGGSAPIRGGNPATWNDDELRMLPVQYRQLVC